MINQEQKELSEYVKQVHLSLRRKSKQIGAEKAWEEHLKNDEVLRKYAFSMKKLAEEFWSNNNRTQKDTVLCRIEWIVTYITNYFRKGLLENELQKEIKKIESFQKKGLVENLVYLKECNNSFQVRLKVLDVGSCYNPFQKFDFLEVYPIDLYPANPEVKKCNFIETVVLDLKEDWFRDNLTQIPSNFFDVVIFSLFLEYLPSPKQRYVACLKAYDCLKTNGLLLIVTPDSKHATANSGLMKSWKIAAAKIGFVRTKLEKLKYLYCMAFRKSMLKLYPQLIYNVQSNEENPEEMFVIPQDSVDYEEREKCIEKTYVDETIQKALFEELPLVEVVETSEDVEAEKTL